MPTPTLPVSWLYEHLTEPNLVILDCRFSLADAQAGRQQYESGHIPGAYYVDLNQDLSGSVGQHGGRHPLPNPMELAEKFAAMGIHSGGNPEPGGNQESTAKPTTVVVYDDGLAFAARCWWLLRYLGHDAVKVLDGGFKAWQAAGYEVTHEVPQVEQKRGQFVPNVRSPWVVDINQVKAQKDLPGVVLIDSREGDRYRGEREPIDPIAGHIPGAINYPWTEILDADGFFLSEALQQQRWATHQSDKILVYCGSGVTACANLLSLEAAGIADAKLYAGSWSDWCSYLD
jgi:thiosulfate/3-mercaptopyruvate sulfurtransferase